jgi:ribosomal protein S8E
VCTRKTRILDVVYNASNNELVRTKTLVKNCIEQIDATHFRAWYEQHYGAKVGVKKAKKDATTTETDEVRFFINIASSILLCIGYYECGVIDSCVFPHCFYRSLACHILFTSLSTF